MLISQGTFMYIYWIAITLLIVAGGIFSQVQHNDEAMAEQATLDAISRSMLIYRSAAAEYALSNPGFIGSPTDASLNLPSWYVKQGDVTSYIAGGISYTFVAAPPTGLPSVLAHHTESATVGVNRQGVLYSPTTGRTSIPVPAAIPDGSVVAVY
jgi:hypothetical protein